YLSGRYGPKLKAIIDMVETIARAGMVDVAAGRTSLRDAQRQVLGRIKALRYDAGTGYIWVNDLGKPYPRMIMHPTSPTLDGTVLSDTKYNTVGEGRKNLFASFVEVCEASGEGYVEYLWPKPTKDGLTEQQPKLSYVRLFKEWGWIVGTGVYIDDAVRDAQAEAMKTLKAMRYDGDVGYFWINDRGRPVPRMIMHPTSPALDGTVLDSPKYNTVGTERKNLFATFVEICDTKGRGFVEYMWPMPTKDGLSEDQPKKSFVRLFEPWGWIVGSGVYTDGIVKTVHLKSAQTRSRALVTIGVSAAISLLLLGFVMAIAGLVLRGITRPLAGVVAAAKLIADGVIVDVKAVGTGREADADSRDEARTLSRNFTVLIGKLRQSVIETQALSARNIEIKKELSAQAELTSSSLVEISANIDGIKQRITTLDGHIQDASGATESINESAKWLDGQIQEQASMVEESTASITEMIVSIGNISKVTEDKRAATESLVSAARAGGERLQDTAVVIDEINRSIDDIRGMADVISGIASQTNLLSMNAAIEAA
ncbi:MAG: methyl-accepting chemotaxis protein, partial [Spirochaetota bacterium]